MWFVSRRGDLVRVRWGERGWLRGGATRAAAERLATVSATLAGMAVAVIALGGIPGQIRRQRGRLGERGWLRGGATRAAAEQLATVSATLAGFDDRRPPRRPQRSPRSVGARGYSRTRG